MEVDEGKKEETSEEKKEEKVDEGDAMRTSVTGMKVNKVQEDVDNLRPKIKSLARFIFSLFPPPQISNCFFFFFFNYL